MAVLSAIAGRGDWRRQLAFTLAAIVLIATAPAAFVPIVTDSVPALTLDICHPLLSIGSPTATTLAAAPARWTAFVPTLRTPARRREHRLTARLADSPDTPPPKAAV